MPLHKRESVREDRESVREEMLDSVFADVDLKKTLPSRDFPTSMVRASDAFQAIADELLLDGNARQNLATFCQTWEEPEVHTLMDIAIDKNLIDKDEYPQSAELERRCVHMLADLWNAPTSPSRWVVRPSGPRRPACSAAWRRSGGGAPSGRPQVSPQTNRTWSVARCRWSGTSSPATGMSRCARSRWPPAATAWTSSRCSSGWTRTPSWSCPLSGSPTPAPTRTASLDALDNLQAEDRPRCRHPCRRGQRRLPRPVLRPRLIWDFRVPRVKSISTSGHKFGLAPLGVGWVLWRDASELPDDLIFHVTYLGGDMPVFQINFSRPAGQIVAQYYNFLRLGRDGYRQVHQPATTRASSWPRRS